jgi:hypothetical protein
MNPRRLTFAVGTTLLTASLSTTVVGCKKNTVNEQPEPPHVNEGPAPEEHVNEGPEEDPAAQEAGSDPSEEDGPNVNTVPE